MYSVCPADVVHLYGASLLFITAVVSSVLNCRLLGISTPVWMPIFFDTDITDVKCKLCSVAAHFESKSNKTCHNVVVDQFWGIGM